MNKANGAKNRMQINGKKFLVEVTLSIVLINLRPFHTPVLNGTIKLPYLRTTPETQKQKGKKRYPI